MKPCPVPSMSDLALLAARHRARVLERQLTLLKAEFRLLERSLEETHRRAHFDALTGLPNRFLLLDRFHQAMAHATRMQTKLALLYLDLDGFKAVNDVLGHATGDELLKRVSVRLLGCIRASDTVCRHGGDEFVVLLTEVADDEGALLAAEKIRAQLALPYVIGETAIQLTTSIGVAVYPMDGSEIEDLLQRSDFAMFRNKGDTSSRPNIFRIDPTPANAIPADHAGDGAEMLEQEAGSPPGERGGEPLNDDLTGKLPRRFVEHSYPDYAE